VRKPDANHPMATDPAYRRRLLVLAVCCVSLLIAGVDTTAVNIALPAVQHDLNAPVSGLQWTIDGYTLAIAGFLMPAGGQADVVEVEGDDFAQAKPCVERDEREDRSRGLTQRSMVRSVRRCAASG
jgi:MFS family permease